MCQGLLVTITCVGVCTCLAGPWCVFWAMCASGCLSVSPCLCLLGCVSVCVGGANTAVAAWSQWLLSVFFNFFFLLPPQHWPSVLSRAESDPLVRSLCPCCPSAGWLLCGHLAQPLWPSRHLWSYKNTIPTVPLKRNKFTQIDMLETNTGSESLLQVSLWN